MNTDWYKIKEVTDSVIMIQEPLRRLAPDYLTNTVNLFLVYNGKEALLIDCGTGLYQINDLLIEILGKRTIVTPFITHSDFDHVGSLHEFENVLIHQDEAGSLTQEEDLETVRIDVKERNDPVIADIPNPFKRLKYTGEQLHVNDGEWIQVGKLELQIIYLPGHTKGSIGLYHPDEKFIFVGDAFQKGYVYADKDPKGYLKTLEKLQELYGNYYMPGHEDILLQEKDLNELINLFNQLEQDTIDKVPLINRYLDNNLVKGDKYSIILPKDYQY